MLQPPPGARISHYPALKLRHLPKSKAIFQTKRDKTLAQGVEFLSLTLSENQNFGDNAR